jgi:dihydroxyacid dehydratase/phosphogluconate dehydratase
MNEITVVTAESLKTLLASDPKWETAYEAAKATCEFLDTARTNQAVAENLGSHYLGIFRVLKVANAKDITCEISLKEIYDVQSLLLKVTAKQADESESWAEIVFSVNGEVSCGAHMAAA